MPSTATVTSTFGDAKQLQRCLVVELTAFCDDDTLIQEVCGEVLANPNIYLRTSTEDSKQSGVAVLVVARAKALVLKRLQQRNVHATRFKDFWRVILPRWMDRALDDDSLVLLCLGMMKLGQPCEWLLTDYYVNLHDRGLVPDHWNMRGQCKKRLRELLSGWFVQNNGGPDI
jgi:hypothetical protein